MKKIIFLTALLPVLIGYTLADATKEVLKPIEKTSFVIYDTTYKKVENYEVKIIKHRVRPCQSLRK